MSRIEQGSETVPTVVVPRGRAAGRSIVVAVLASLAVTLSGCSLIGSDSQSSMTLGTATNTSAAKDFTKAETLRSAQPQHCDRAIPLYLSAIRKNPIFVSAYSGLATCYALDGDYDGAILEYNRAIAIDPENYGLYLGRAGAEAVNGNTGAATEDNRNALRYAPAQVPTYVSIAQSFTTVANFAEAISTIGKAIALVPDNSSLYQQRAKWYLLMQDTRHAFDDARQALKVAPNPVARATIDVDLATVYGNRGDTNSALIASAEAIRLQPNIAYYYIQSGDLHRNLGLLDGALSRYDEALKLARAAGDREAALEGKGDALRSLGRFKEAIPLYQQALRLVRGDPNKQYVLKTKIDNAKLGQA